MFRLADAAKRIAPQRSWDDLKLPGNTLTQLKDAASRAHQGARLNRELRGVHDVIRRQGQSILLVGPGGTGKSVAAEALATELRMSLLRVDLGAVASKFIGETEKNLDRVFDLAQEKPTVLLFDEADALFGKRTDVRDSHDRYANVELSYLLQRMEAFKGGLVIVSSNRKEPIDDAFARRFDTVIEFACTDQDKSR